MKRQQNGPKVGKAHSIEHRLEIEEVKSAWTAASGYAGEKVSQMLNSELPLSPGTENASFPCRVNQGGAKNQDSLRPGCHGGNRHGVDEELPHSQETALGTVEPVGKPDKNARQPRPGRKPKKRPEQLGCAGDLLGVVRQLLPDMNLYLSEVKDPRDPRRVTYAREGLLWCMIIQRLGIVDSARLWEDISNQEVFLPNINTLSGCDFEHVPHSDTVKYFAARLDPDELNKILHKCFIFLRKNKRLDQFKCEGEFTIAVDATEFHTSQHSMEHCCHRKLTNGNTEYFQSALVASLVSANGVRITLSVEFIENNEGAGEYNKQDCEIKAFFRLAQKLNSLPGFQ